MHFGISWYKMICLSTGWYGAFVSIQNISFVLVSTWYNMVCLELSGLGQYGNPWRKLDKEWLQRK